MLQNDSRTIDSRQYINPPAPDSTETQAARAYNALSYVPGTLIRPAYSIGDSVWVFELGVWLKATVIDNSESVEIGTYKVRILGEPDEIGTSYFGGQRILKRLDTDHHDKGLETFMDDMPDIEYTIKAKDFLNSGINDFTPKKNPTYKRGDTVWLYRRRQNIWVTATVVDVRFV